MANDSHFIWSNLKFNICSTHQQQEHQPQIDSSERNSIALPLLPFLRNSSIHQIEDLSESIVRQTEKLYIHLSGASNATYLSKIESQKLRAQFKSVYEKKLAHDFKFISNASNLYTSEKFLHDSNKTDNRRRTFVYNDYFYDDKNSNNKKKRSKYRHAVNHDWMYGLYNAAQAADLKQNIIEQLHETEIENEKEKEKPLGGLIAKKVY